MNEKRVHDTEMSMRWDKKAWSFTLLLYVKRVILNNSCISIVCNFSHISLFQLAFVQIA